MKRTLTITALLLAAIGCRPVPDATLEGRVTLDGRPVAGVLVSDVTADIEGRHVLILEDIFDTGNSLEFTVNHLKDEVRHPLLRRK